MAKRDLVILGSFYARRERQGEGKREKRKETRTCRICSRSSANASAKDAIQNCLNRFRRACSSWALLLEPSGGRNGGASAGGGEGEGDWCQSRALAGPELEPCGIAEEDSG